MRELKYPVVMKWVGCKGGEFHVNFTSRQTGTVVWSNNPVRKVGYLAFDWVGADRELKWEPVPGPAPVGGNGDNYVPSPFKLGEMFAKEGLHVEANPYRGCPKNYRKFVLGYQRYQERTYNPQPSMTATEVDNIQRAERIRKQTLDPESMVMLSDLRLSSRYSSELQFLQVADSVSMLFTLDNSNRWNEVKFHHAVLELVELSAVQKAYPDLTIEVKYATK